MSTRILTGDMRERLRDLPDASIDSVVTDPPYHLTSIVKRFGASNAAPPKSGKTGAYSRASRGFMGQTWDGGDVAFRTETWAEVLRVMKPGAHLLAFSGTRTYHRMVCAIEDAGFEVRDQIAWLYGSGFPKSHDVSKAIDKAAGADRRVVGRKMYADGHVQNSRESIGYGGCDPAADARIVTEPATDEARKWQGWGTALKPSQEPVCLAQKPYTFEQEWVTIRHLIERLWSALWLTLPANDAAQFSTLSPSACGVDPSAFAQWIAEQRCNTLAALSGLTDTSPLGSALITSLNTVSSWNDTLAASCLAASTSTTGTGSSATTDLRTLRFCLSQITPASIIQAHKSGRWSNADACNAARLFNASVAMLSATLELSAVESATDWEAIYCPDAGAPKPNWEPICLARKPLIGTVASNIAAHGTGAINIDGCRVGTEGARNNGRQAGTKGIYGHIGATECVDYGMGRWPANIIHDGSDEVLAGFPHTESGVLKAGTIRNVENRVYGKGASAAGKPATDYDTGGDSGSAARFFYSAKADQKERHAGCEDLEKRNSHPTVKPIDLMRWLIRLVTPRGGLVLDPFMGSGSTLIAAHLEQCRAIGVEMTPEYVEIARRRIAHAQGLFADVEVAA